MYRLAANGEMLPPCGVPVSLRVHAPSSSTPAANHCWISRTTRLSPIRRSTNRMSCECSSGPKKSRRSASSTQFTRFCPIAWSRAASALRVTLHAADWFANFALNLFAHLSRPPGLLQLVQLPPRPADFRCAPYPVARDRARRPPSANRSFRPGGGRCHVGSGAGERAQPWRGRRCSRADSECRGRYTARALR
jgi:hypothetical protein